MFHANLKKLVDGKKYKLHSI